MAVRRRRVEFITDLLMSCVHKHGSPVLPRSRRRRPRRHAGVLVAPWPTSVCDVVQNSHLYVTVLYPWSELYGRA